MSDAFNASDQEGSLESGARLKQARLRAGKSQQEVADAVGVTQATISNWERGGPGAPNEFHRRAIERLLDQPLADADTTVELSVSTDLGLWLRSMIERKKREEGKTMGTIAAEVQLAVPTLYNIMNGAVDAPQSLTLQKLKDYFGDLPEEVAEETKIARDIGQLGEFSQFDAHNESEWPTEPGVYVLYDIYSRPTYIGKSYVSIASRLRDHTTRFWYRRPLVAQGAYVGAHDRKLIHDIENLLIKMLGSLAVINERGIIRDTSAD